MNADKKKSCLDIEYDETKLAQNDIDGLQKQIYY